jgi:LPXTG-motif cell wall-anchored protein
MKKILSTLLALAAALALLPASRVSASAANARELTVAPIVFCAASVSETALPRTGDNLDPLLWLSLMAAAALCLAAVLLWNRRRKPKQ